MSNETQSAPPPAALLDRGDSRVKHASGIGGTVSAFVDRVRSGDLGSLPVIVGLISGMGGEVRFYRTVMLDEMYQDYVRTAFAKGCGQKTVGPSTRTI